MVTSWQDVFDSQAGELRDAMQQIDAAPLDALAELIRAAPRMFLAGRGRSGLMMQGFAMRLMHLGKASHVLGDVTTPATQADDLLIIGSGSGATPSLVTACDRAVGLGANVALITIDPQSPIGRAASVAVRIPAPSPKAAQGESVRSIQPMGTLFEQCLGLVCDAVVMRLMQMSGITAEQMFDQHANIE